MILLPGAAMAQFSGCPSVGAVAPGMNFLQGGIDPNSGAYTPITNDPNNSVAPITTDTTDTNGAAAAGSPTIGGLTQDQINANYEASVANAGASTNETAGINQAAGNNPDANVLLPSVLGNPSDTSTSTPANQVPAGSNQSPGETWTGPVNNTGPLPDSMVPGQ